MNFQLFIISLIIFSLILPIFSYAQTPQYTAQMPQTMEEAKSLGLKILERLPDAVKEIWQKEALPFWRKMWQEAQGPLNTYIKPFFEKWWNKFLSLLGKEVEKRRPVLEPVLEEELQKETKEMQKDLWERFKELLE
jgi:endo-1,4-beta-mannosidase